MLETPVLIAGGGPVGLLLGHELAARGVEALLVEINPTTTNYPKMDITHSRSMEHFRRLGIADAVYDAAVAADSPLDITWITRMNEWELCRFPYPSIDQQRNTIRENNDGAQPAEAQIRISQIIVEPVLKHALEAKPEIEVRFGWGLESFVQDADGVTAIIAETETGKQEQVRCQYPAGCDGGGSTTRKQLGVEWEGTAKAVSAFMIHFRSTAYDVLQHFGKSWHYQSPVLGSMICQDDVQYWTLHVICPPGEEPTDFDAREKLFDFVGEEFDCEILRANPYHGHMLVTESYGRDRVWLAGDAAHQYFPTGGYGMNTGVVDAAGLGWTLAARIQGWGGPQLFSAYEIERRPLAIRNRGWSYEHVDVRTKIAQAYSPLLHEDNDAGAQARAEIGQYILDLTNIENECWGVQHGYRYSDSPIVCDDDGTPPEFDPLSFSDKLAGHAPTAFVSRRRHTDLRIVRHRFHVNALRRSRHNRARSRRAATGPAVKDRRYPRAQSARVVGARSRHRPPGHDGRLARRAPPGRAARRYRYYPRRCLRRSPPVRRPGAGSCLAATPALQRLPRLQRASSTIP